MLDGWNKRAEAIRSGRLSATDVEIIDYQNVPLSKHISEYLDDLRERGVNADRIKTSEKYLTDDSAAFR